MSEGTPPNQAGDVRGRLRQALGAALRDRDPVAASALRSALAAIDNAEAVPAPQAAATPAGSAHIAGGAAGLGAGEAPRRRLSASAAAAIVEAEIAERRAAAAEYEHAGHGDRAGRLRHEADILASAATTTYGGLT